MANSSSLTWKLQHSNRPKGRYFQAVHGKGKERLALTLGYLSEEEASLAHQRVTTLPAPGSLASHGVAGPTGEDGPLHNNCKAAMTATVRQLLLGCNVEEAVEAVAHSEGATLELAGNYGEMRLRDFHKLVWLPIRKAERAEKTVKRESQCWDAILPVLGDTKVKRLDAVKWSRFLASQTTWGGRAKAIAQNAYKCSLTYAAEIGAIEKVHSFRPIKGSTVVAKPKESLLAHEVALLLDAARTPTHRALFGVLFGQGLRPGEATACRWEDVDFTSRTILIRGTKTDLSRATVPMTPLTVKELRAFWMAQGQPSEGLCFTWGGKPIKEFKHAIESAGKRAGISRKVTPYMGRHSFASLAAMAGIPKAATKRMMRHSHASTILERAYSNVREEQVRDAFSAFQLPETEAVAAK